MASLRTLAGLLSLALGAQAALVSKNGQTAVVPNWDLVSSSDVGSTNLASLAQPGVDTSSWHHIPVSKCTLMGCLISAGVYDVDELWFSDNLRRFNWGQFSVPWIYRNEFALEAAPEEQTKKKGKKHYFLQTHGISSRADIFLNGKQIANKRFQSGAYAGHEYDITGLVRDKNALVVQAYPTNYAYDLALGFVDWNPYPPDNGTGVWRDITVKQTGSIVLGSLSAAVDIDPATVVLRSTARNLENKQVKYLAEAIITSPDGKTKIKLKQEASLKPKESRVIEFTHHFDHPQLWWPKTWGNQPLYNARMTLSVDASPSDVVERTFGLRTVTSKINKFKDITYYVNKQKFQVVGGGYSADMFLRWDPKKFEHMALYSLDMGLNTIRLEGKNEHPELYEIADRLGLMVMVGWECCDKWEAWEYNDQLGFDPFPTWTESDYRDANASMRHEAAMLQTHPSVLTFLVGSDFWPNDRATGIYVDALRSAHFQLPIVASASKRGYPKELGPSGMKMEGPYDWVPPNYWFNVEPAEERYGAAFSFGSELGPGVGTPERSSLIKFLSEKDMQDLWQHPDKGLYHMSTNVSSFYNRAIYNRALWNRLGKPTSLDDYLLKAQIMDYEGIRAEFEAFAARWSEDRPATGLIYWMLNNAWPSLHWNQFDAYLHPAASYFGTKAGARLENVAYNYQDRNLWLINRSLDKKGSRTVEIDIVDLKGKTLKSYTLNPKTTPNMASKIGDVPALNNIKDVVFLRVVLKSGNTVFSRNVYWIAPTVDKLNWANSTWYYTPVTKYANYQPLMSMDPAAIKATASSATSQGNGILGSKSTTHSVTLENTSKVPAFFVSMNLVDAKGEDVLPVVWSENYVTLWPGEKMSVSVTGWDDKAALVKLKGANVKAVDIKL